MRNILWLLAGNLLLVSGLPVSADPARFDPERHFPKETYFYADVDFRALRRGWKRTPLGAIASHPGVRKALGKLPDEFFDMVRRVTDDFEQEMGIDLLEFLDLFQGRIAVTIPEVDVREGPRMIVGMDMRENRKKILQTTERLCRTMHIQGEPQTTSVLGHKVKSFQPRYGPTLRYASVGRALLFSVGHDLDDVIRRMEGKKAGSRLRSNAELKKVRLQTPGFKPLATCFANVEKMRETMYQVLEMERGPGHEVKVVMEALGLDKISSASYQLALTDGDWEARFLIRSPGGLSGALKIVAESFSGPEDLSGLEKVPASASAVSCYSIRTGQFFREALAVLRKVGESFPELTGVIDTATGAFENFTGLSIRRDIYTLPRLNIYSFQVMPPAKSAIADFLTVCKTKEIAPYVALLDRLAKKVGAQVEPLEVGGHTLAYLKLDGLLEKFGLPGAGSTGMVGPVPISMDTGFSIVFASLDSDWMVVTSSPQSARRYLDVYARGKKISEVDEVKNFLQERVARGTSFDLLRDGKALLAFYNSMVSAAQLVVPMLGLWLEPYDVDPAHLPAAEEFAHLFKPGFLLTRARSDSLLIHGHRALTNALGSSLSMLTSVIPGMALGVFGARQEQVEVASGVAGNTAEARLRNLYKALVTYAGTPGRRAFPYSTRNNLTAFRRFLASGALKGPSMLVHPASGGRPAVRGPDGKFKLRGENLSYVLVPWKQGPKDSPSRMLCYEKKAYARGGRHVLFVGGNVQFFPEEVFLKLLDAQTKRYARKSKKKSSGKKSRAKKSSKKTNTRPSTAGN